MKQNEQGDESARERGELNIFHNKMNRGMHFIYRQEVSLMITAFYTEGGKGKRHSEIYDLLKT